jgi:hypothetical protein
VSSLGCYSISAFTKVTIAWSSEGLHWKEESGGKTAFQAEIVSLQRILYLLAVETSILTLV